MKTTLTGPQEKTLRGLIRQGRVSPAPIRVELAYKQFVQARRLHHKIKLQHGEAFASRFQQDLTPLHERTICHWSPAKP